jgi:hypothetical protein
MFIAQVLLLYCQPRQGRHVAPTELLPLKIIVSYKHPVPTGLLHQRLGTSLFYYSSLVTIRLFYLTMPNIGEWFVSRTLPLPRYMCTPQGRQGSKLLTARMISMPLKLSGPFSSKMGVFCTASS